MGDKNAKLSVLMSFYKEPIKWLRASMDSILQQSYTDFEFIIICDNPTNFEGKNLLEKYRKIDDRILLIINEKNMGLTKSLNKGLAHAKGEYIARIDADDIAMPDRLEKQVRFMDENPEIVASGTSAYNMYEDKTTYSRRPSSPRLLYSMSIFDSPISHPSAIFRRVVDGKEVRYDETFKYSQDYALWLSLMEHHKVSNIDEPLIKYRISNEQISNSNHAAQQEFALKNQRKAIELLKLDLTGSEVKILQDITRRPGEKHDLKLVKESVENIVKKIEKRKDLDTAPMLFKLVLLYANYLPRHIGMVKGLCELTALSLRTKHLYGYAYLSLVNKYFRR